MMHIMVAFVIDGREYNIVKLNNASVPTTRVSIKNKNMLILGLLHILLLALLQLLASDITSQLRTSSESAGSSLLGIETCIFCTCSS
jgi:hypothetical protein